MRKFLYVKVYPGELVARVIGSPREFTVECPELVHPRSLIGSFEVLTKALEKVVAESRAVRLLIIKPKLLIHLIPKVEGDYTQPELRACRQAALGAGFMSVLVCGSQYGPLSDQELEQFRPYSA